MLRFSETKKKTNNEIYIGVRFQKHRLYMSSGLKKAKRKKKKNLCNTPYNKTDVHTTQRLCQTGFWVYYEANAWVVSLLHRINWFLATVEIAAHATEGW